MKTYSIIRQIPDHPETREILMSGIYTKKEDGFKFRPVFELKLIREQRITYYNEFCTEVADWCFNVTETKSNGSKALMNYRIIEE